MREALVADTLLNESELVLLREIDTPIATGQ